MVRFWSRCFKQDHVLELESLALTFDVGHALVFISPFVYVDLKTHILRRGGAGASRALAPPAWPSRAWPWTAWPWMASPLKGPAWPEALASASERPQVTPQEPVSGDGKC